MTMHNVRIHISGVNAFTEQFPGGSPAAAKQLAKTRYPNATRVDWQGAVAAPRQEMQPIAQDPNDRRNINDLKMDAPHNPITLPKVEAPQSGGGCAVALIAGGAAVGLAVFFAPVIAAVGTGRIANKGTRGRGLKTRVAATLLAGVAACAGTAALQKEYMPELHQTHLEMLNIK